MKKKINAKILAASICVACLSGITSVQADSLLAPFVVSDVLNGFETTLSYKVRGTGVADHGWARFGTNEANISKLHYIWLQKGTTIGSLYNRTSSCNHVDNNGSVSPWDMLNQTVNPANQWIAQRPGSDATIDSVHPTKGTPGGSINNPATPFYGMAILDDVASLAANGNVEGNSSGFAYVINYFTGIMLDYKLVNNHKTAASGDFSAGFMRKTSVDLSWNPIDRDLTFWLAVATGAGMTSGNGWGGSITISQATNTSLTTTQASPTVPHGGSTGVYNNDEVNLSGDTPINITCMGLFTRGNFMNPTQLAGTVDGGWTRKSIIGANGSTGGMVYKAELKTLASRIAGTPIVAFQPETSGHLATSGLGPRPNRPY